MLLLLFQNLFIVRILKQGNDVFHSTREQEQRLSMRCWHPTNTGINKDSVSGGQSIIISFTLAWLAEDLDSPCDSSLKKRSFSQRFPPNS